MSVKLNLMIDRFISFKLNAFLFKTSLYSNIKIYLNEGEFCRDKNMTK